MNVPNVLKPCPFCGNDTADLYSRRSQPWTYAEVRCETCGVIVTSAGIGIVKLWNCRDGKI